MESRRTGWKIATILGGAWLLCLISDWSLAAQGATPRSRDLSFAAAAAVSASQTQSDAGARESGPVAASDDADAAFDGSAGTSPPFADIPLSALFLVGVCLLAAALGPHARPSRQDIKQDAVLPESHVGREGRAPN
jgi:hypothetical protein